MKQSLLVVLSAGIVYGLSAGFSPGPLLALVLAQTLTHGLREGIKVAIAPLITDLPIILASLLLVAQLTRFEPALGLISLCGALLLLRLAYDSLRTGGLQTGQSNGAPQSLSKGALVNLLSPHPYLFWTTVGAPTMLRAWVDGPALPLLFVASFFACIIGAKILVALLAERARPWLNGRLYCNLMRGLGLLLLVFAGLLLWDGLHLLGLL